MQSAGIEDRAGTTDSPSAEETAAQVERVLASPPFQHSNSLSRLLTFLADRSVTNPGEPVKEIELAISVYNLTTESFDPQVDSAVRVKMGRLRAKILEYYASCGQNDAVVLDIPKGSYCLISHYRPLSEPAAEPAPQNLALVETRPEPGSEAVHMPPLRSRKSRLWIWAAIFLLGAALGSIGSVLKLHSMSPAKPVPAHLKQFWSGLAGNGQPSIAVFSNPRLVGVLAHGGLHYPGDPEVKPDAPMNLGYAGAGDVLAMHALTNLFDRLDMSLGVESGALLSWELAKDSNLIFIDRPEQNPALEQLPRLHEFYFKYDVGIVNAHPRPGEQATYQYSKPDNTDYAVIAYIPGIHAQENTLVLAGNTTLGSLAAVEFMTNDRSVANLFDRLQVRPGQKVPYFEALLETHVNNYTPVWSSILAVRPYSSGTSSWDTPTPDER